MRCWDAPNRPGTGEGYQRDRGSLLEPSYFLTRAGRLLCLWGVSSALASLNYGAKRTGSLHTHQRLPQHPWVSPSPLTFSVFTDSVSLVGMLAVGRRKGLRQCAVWQDVPGGGPGADSQEPGRRVKRPIRSTRLSSQVSLLPFPVDAEKASR